MFRSFWFILTMGINMVGGMGCAGTLTSPHPALPTLIPTANPLPTPTLAPVLPTPPPIHTPTAISNIAPTPLLTTTTPLPIATPVLHIVVEGETLSSIADHYQLLVEAMLQTNNLFNPDQLTVGQSLIIPIDSAQQLPIVTPTYRLSTIGYSAEGRPINLYSFGTGQTEIVFVGGIHGGYEWNSILLAYQALDYFNTNPHSVPANLTIHLIPNANPDGLFRVTGKEGSFSAANVAADSFTGRFNGQNVDLNRNWGCNWSAEAYWRDVRINAGTEPFSEPETQVLRDFFLQTNIEAVIFWHSAAGLVIPGRCSTEHADSIALADIYSQAAGYTLSYFTAYQVNGDASDWLVEQGIASIAVELNTHELIEWEKNSAGIFAVLSFYTK